MEDVPSFKVIIAFECRGLSVVDFQFGVSQWCDLCILLGVVCPWPQLMVSPLLDLELGQAPQRFLLLNLPDSEYKIEARVVGLVAWVTTLTQYC